jgi:uncharacterized protein YdhG (YjbR/CyaY superfamily)
MAKGNKMQEMDFKSIDEFLAFLPEEELVIVERLRKLVFYCLPEAREKLSFNVPYYYHHRNFCFIWPASVTWGKQKTYEGVRFGFAYGNQLTDEIGYLDKGGQQADLLERLYRSVKEIDIELLQAYIYEAIIIDEEHFRKKKSKILKK